MKKLELLKIQKSIKDTKLELYSEKEAVLDAQEKSLLDIGIEAYESGPFYEKDEIVIETDSSSNEASVAISRFNYDSRKIQITANCFLGEFKYSPIDNWDYDFIPYSRNHYKCPKCKYNGLLNEYRYCPNCSSELLWTL